MLNSFKLKQFCKSTLLRAINLHHKNQKKSNTIGVVLRFSRQRVERPW